MAHPLEVIPKIIVESIKILKLIFYFKYDRKFKFLPSYLHIIISILINI